MKFNFFRMRFENELKMLGNYQDTMEVQLVEAQKSELRLVEERIKALEAGEEEAMILEEHEYIYGVIFPRSLRYSFIVLLFLNLESLLNEFCNAVQKKNNVALRCNEIRGESVERSKIYLHKLAKVNLIDLAFWNSIEDFSKVRNCIVHTLGKVDQSRDKLRLQDISKQGTGLTIGNAGSEEGFIILSNDYCKKIIVDVESLFRELFDKAGYGPSFSL
ncbi:MAG: hypothetical protein P4L35_20270 [Ignavibacteriaceae bacterium]|nr:hypothetical protein [Ignavibacteriaceae bacterium]